MAVLAERRSGPGCRAARAGEEDGVDPRRPAPASPPGSSGCELLSPAAAAGTFPAIARRNRHEASSGRPSAGFCSWPRATTRRPRWGTGARSGSGSFENRNREPSAKQKAATRCLLDAFARGRPAELVATYRTIEGDPWAEYYRVLGPRRVEVFVNASDDRYANTGWAHWICSGLAYADSIDQFVHEGCRAISVDEVVTAGYDIAPRPGAGHLAGDGAIPEASESCPPKSSPSSSPTSSGRPRTCAGWTSSTAKYWTRRARPSAARSPSSAPARSRAWPRVVLGLRLGGGRGRGRDLRAARAARRRVAAGRGRAHPHGPPHRHRDRLGPRARRLRRPPRRTPGRGRARRSVLLSEQAAERSGAGRSSSAAWSSAGVPEPAAALPARRRRAARTSRRRASRAVSTATASASSWPTTRCSSATASPACSRTPACGSSRRPGAPKSCSSTWPPPPRTWPSSTSACLRRAPTKA